jgi:sugar phosphate isomerase/epimerase
MLPRNDGSIWRLPLANRPLVAKGLLVLVAAGSLALGAALAREPSQDVFLKAAAASPRPRPVRDTDRLVRNGASKFPELLTSSAFTSVQTPVKRLGGPRLKISLNAYSFNKTLNDQLKGRGKGMTLFDLLDFCAENNFDAIDPTGYFFPGYPRPPSAQYLNEFKRRAFVLGLDISGTGVRNNFASPDKDKRAADVKHVKEWVEVAARMGAPVLRVFAGKQPEGHAWDEVAGWMVKDLKECVAHGKKHGVIIGIQNHGDMLQTADQVLKIVKAVNEPEWFGVIVDTGYFPIADTYKHIAAVAPYAVNWQVKEHLGGKGGTLKTDLKQIVRIARAAGYRGYLPIETLPVPGATYDPRARVRQVLRELRAALKEAE